MNLNSLYLSLLKRSLVNAKALDFIITITRLANRFIYLHNQAKDKYLIYNCHMDRLTKEQRHKNMQAVKNKDSKIELMLRSALWSKGYRYKKNYAKLDGKPDIVLSKYKTVIFCDSEFWHGYNWDVRKHDIKSNRDFWVKKIEGNIQRDKIVNKKLKEQGWKVLRFWGKDIQKNLDKCLEKIEKEIGVQ